MPQFIPISLRRAKGRRTRRRSPTLREYRSYISRLSPGQAGYLVPSEGETALQVRWRIGAAARASGKTIVIRRNGDDVYFWERV